MPAVSSPSDQPLRTTTADRATRVRFRRAVSLMVMTLLIPGSAQLVAGNRRVGLVAIRIWGALVVAGVVAVATSTVWPDVVFWAVANVSLLTVMRLVLIGLAVGWAALFVDAWRLGRPLSLHQGQRLAVVGMNGVLCLSVAGALLFGAHLVGVQRDFMTAMFGDGPATPAHHGRYNILLLGADSGADRWGMRPDSMTVASIDADTGKTVLISLPRNLADFPFRPGSVMDRQFPDGFSCDGCYLNAVSTWAQDHTDVFPHSHNPGLDATIMAVEGVTGLRVNYWAMVNLAGFEDLVDAMGGITLNVRDRIPVGGLGDDVTGYIEPGVRRLNGHDALWFARAREGSDDYSRMARQKCVLGAMLDQFDPKVAVTRFESLAAAGAQTVSTDLPAKEAARFLSLAMRAKDQKLTTVSLVPPLIDTADPDMGVIRRAIRRAIGISEGTVTPRRHHHKPDKDMTGGSLGTLQDGYAANQADDLDKVC